MPSLTALGPGASFGCSLLCRFRRFGISAEPSKSPRHEVPRSIHRLVPSDPEILELDVFLTLSPRLTGGSVIPSAAVTRITGSSAILSDALTRIAGSSAILSDALTRITGSSAILSDALTGSPGVPPSSPTPSPGSPGVLRPSPHDALIRITGSSAILSRRPPRITVPSPSSTPPPQSVPSSSPTPSAGSPVVSWTVSVTFIMLKRS